MSTNRDKAIELLNKIDDNQLDDVIAFLQDVLIPNDEEVDDAFCDKLVRDYLEDSDVKKHESVSIEEFASQCGVKL